MTGSDPRLDLDPLASPLVGIAAVVLWVAWRDRQRVRQFYRSAHAGGLDFGEPKGAGQKMSLRDAEREVWSELMAGRIAARCSVASDMRENLSISPSLWSDLTWRRTGTPDALWTYSSPVVRFAYVYVETREALNRWPEAESASKVHGGAPAIGRGDAKLSDAAQALRDLYPKGPPLSTDRPFMQKQVEAKIGRSISLPTLDRARKDAWK